jgi:hypothetical protein
MLMKQSKGSKVIDPTGTFHRISKKKNYAHTASAMSELMQIHPSNINLKIQPLR